MTAGDELNGESTPERTPRIAPGPWIGLAVSLTAIAAGTIASLLIGADYETMAESSAGLLRAVIIPSGVATAFLVVAVSWLGWWRPVLRQRRSGPTWAWLIPILSVTASVMVISASGFSGVQPGHMVTIVVAALIVGIAEELSDRGVLLVGFRARLGEGWVWFLTSLVFGLSHALNLLTGQDVGSTVGQVIATFGFATVVYVARMVSGTLLLPIALHMLTDVGALGAAASADVRDALLNAGAATEYLAVLLALIAVPFVIRSYRRGAQDSAAPPDAQDRAG